jgi:hypothetical protein
MTVNITWSLDAMSTSTQSIDGFSEVVVNAVWRCTGNEGEYMSSDFGVCSFPLPQSGGSFTPYADLTLNDVLGWCWANGVDKTAIEAKVTLDTQEQANPTVVIFPLPWATQGA